MKYEIHTLEERCKGCLICIDICQAEVLRLSDDVNKNGYHFPLIANIEACIGCAMCEMFCPDLAIWVTSDEKETIQ